MRISHHVRIGHLERAQEKSNRYELISCETLKKIGEQLLDWIEQTRRSIDECLRQLIESTGLAVTQSDYFISQKQPAQQPGGGGDIFRSVRDSDASSIAHLRKGVQP